MLRLSGELLLGRLLIYPAYLAFCFDSLLAGFLFLFGFILWADYGYSRG